MEGWAGEQKFHLIAIPFCRIFIGIHEEFIGSFPGAQSVYVQIVPHTASSNLEPCCHGISASQQMVTSALTQYARWDGDRSLCWKGMGLCLTIPFPLRIELRHLEMCLFLGENCHWAVPLDNDTVGRETKKEGSNDCFLCSFILTLWW